MLIILIIIRCWWWRWRRRQWPKYKTLKWSPSHSISMLDNIFIFGTIRQRYLLKWHFSKGFVVMVFKFNVIFLLKCLPSCCLFYLCNNIYLMKYLATKMQANQMCKYCFLCFSWVFLWIYINVRGIPCRCMDICVWFKELHSSHCFNNML